MTITTIVQRVQKVGVGKSGFLAFIFLFLVSAPFLPPPGSMPEQGLSALAILLFGIFLWLTKVISPAVTSIVVIVLFSLYHILTFEQAASGLGKDVIWLIIVMLSMGAAVQKAGLDKRISFYMLAKSKGKTNATTFMLILIAFLLTFFIPNGMGRLAVLLPISMGLIETMQEGKSTNFNKVIMLSITYVPWVCTVVLITGANGSIYAASLFESMLGFQWTYIHWLIVMLPGVFLTLVGLWVLLLRLFPPEVSHIGHGQKYLEQSLYDLGPVSLDEKKLIGLYGILIFLWSTKEFHGMSIAMVACLVGVLIFVPGINLLSWKEAREEVDWGIPLLFAAGFTIAAALEESGMILWLSDVATMFLVDLPAFLLALTVMVVFVILRFGFTHYAGMVASLMPVALTFAIATPYNPIWLGMICVVASSIAYILPTQSISNMTTYTLGFYDAKDMIKAGSYLTLLIIIVTLTVAFVYWPLVGIPIDKF